MAYEIGEQVLALKGAPGTIEPDRKFVGRLGTVKGFGDKVAGEQSYLVEFENGSDVIDGANLQKVYRL